MTRDRQFHADSEEAYERRKNALNTAKLVIDIFELSERYHPESIQSTANLNKKLSFANKLSHYLETDKLFLRALYHTCADFGYDVADYRDISPEYGSMQDFNRLVAEAKKRNIRVVMDMVMNHASDENAWFVLSRSSRTDPYRDW